MKIAGMNIARAIALCLLALVAVPVMAAEDQSASNMEILRDKIKADKKLLVAANMQLTEAEAEKFWPVYEEYQKELASLNKRWAVAIEEYAQAYGTDKMTDELAKKLVDEVIAIDEAEATVKKNFVPKLSAVLPSMKVARYLQIENKIRAVGNYELAASVPLME